HRFLGPVLPLLAGQRREAVPGHWSDRTTSAGARVRARPRRRRRKIYPVALAWRREREAGQFHRDFIASLLGPRLQLTRKLRHQLWLFPVEIYRFIWIGV